MYENPMIVDDKTDSRLHNVFTKEIMNEDIRNSLLNIQEMLVASIRTSENRDLLIEVSRCLIQSRETRLRISNLFIQT